ncbi:N-acetylmuramoyl-L-alanine amidase [Actinoplanes awajinensis]|uniref:Peptidoglycan recognition protein family domain-containing protein n=1 Tax=Actinoplanes awajinensis subsp. mycoplanecinus TaxID=135947 RepID=A0A0X3UYN9_9ACTN|nr:N-acetylmuramoyl-L-alanine amidase [Actinoplanes awajinensis]KUL37598.1 hypothetical protein ADL15_11270 [Actinoplanes awajinensis subsp. mycoplanecinus]
MKRRATIGIGAAVAVLAAGGGVAVLTWPSGPGSGGSTVAAGVTVLPPEPNAEPPRITTALHTLDVASPAGVPQRDTDRFSLLGVTWADPADKPSGTVQVRTRGVATGRWSGWQSLSIGDTAPDGAEAAAPGRRGATDPLWVGDSDGVATRIQGQAGGLPAGLRLDLIDPGREPGGSGGGMVLEEDPTGAPSASTSVSPSASPSSEGTPSESPSTGVPSSSAPSSLPPATLPSSSVPSPSRTTAAATTATTTPPATASTPAPVPTSTVPVKAQFPAYVSRKQWSADETIVGPVSVAPEVKALWVHHTVHTANSNDYSCADSAAIVRSIQIYDVKSNGWSDLGYNYMLDKCGTLFEGRRGGVETPVVGAHTVGFNTGYAAVAVLGDYRSAPSNDAIETTIAQLAAARLGKYGYNPTSSVTVVAGVTNGKWKQGDKVTVPRLAGHSDMDATLCPGANLYTRLPAIRAKSQLMVTGLTLKSVTGGYAGGAWYVRNTATLTWTMATAAAEVARIEVQVDGRKVSTLAGTARSASPAITPGRHTVTVLAVHTSGSTARVGATVYGDPTAPTLTTPAVNLRTGAYSTASVPVAVGFTARDNLTVASITVSKPRAAVLAGTVSGWATTVKPGGRLTYTVTARDVAGNTRTASANRAVVLLAETKAKKTGTWTNRSAASYVGGRALTANKKNAKLTYTFTGRSAALLFARGPRTGKAYVYLDGKKVATLDTKSGSTTYRQALWVKALTAKKHTVMIVVAGTGGRPAVVSDGLAYVS